MPRCHRRKKRRAGCDGGNGRGEARLDRDGCHWGSSEEKRSEKACEVTRPPTYALRNPQAQGVSEQVLPRVGDDHEWHECHWLNGWHLLRQASARHRREGFAVNVKGVLRLWDASGHSSMWSAPMGTSLGTEAWRTSTGQDNPSRPICDRQHGPLFTTRFPAVDRRCQESTAQTPSNDVGTSHSMAHLASTHTSFPNNTSWTRRVLALSTSYTTTATPSLQHPCRHCPTPPLIRPRPTRADFFHAPDFLISQPTGTCPPFSHATGRHSFAPRRLSGDAPRGYRTYAGHFPSGGFPGQIELS